MRSKIRRLLSGLGREARGLRRRVAEPQTGEWLEFDEQAVTRGVSQLGAATVLSGVDYVRFEDVFYDSSTVVRYQSHYVDSLRRAPAVDGRIAILDIGCGRGEFLRLLRGAGLDAIGVEPNEAEARALSAQGFQVLNEDALAALEKQPPASLSAVCALQVIEHLQPAYLTALLRLASARLVDGGLLLIETPNVKCALVQASFWVDLTHVRPYPYETVAFHMLESGVGDLRVLMSGRAPDEYRRAGVPEANYVNYALLGRKLGTTRASTREQ